MMPENNSLDRRAFMAFAGRAILGGSAALALPQVARGAIGALPAGRPNVVLIVTDDQGYGDLGHHGNEKIKTPNLDQLAREGIELTQFYVCPMGSLTRASLMTGRYSYRTGVVDSSLGRSMMYSDERTFVETLAATGYRTGIFGKWHLGDNYPMRPTEQGFQEALVHKGGGIGQPADPPGNTYFDPILQHNNKPEKQEGYCTDIFTKAAIQFITSTPGYQPFFCYLSTNAPHAPLQIDEKHVEPYRKAELPEETAKTYGMIVNIDENVGRLLETLKARSLDQRTIVVFLTDNGPCESQGPARFNAGLRGLKGSVYDGGIRVPCFWRWVGILEAGKKIDRIAAHVDVGPTILQLCGAGTPLLDGRSLMPLLLGKKVEWPDRTLYFQWQHSDVPQPYRNCAVRSQRYKLINGNELHDMAADPEEKMDIAAAHRDVVTGMRRDYEKWFQDVSATRGYDPPRIPLATPHENPVILTRQDWRGPRAGWEPNSQGYWEVDITRDGSFEVTVQFEPAKAAGEVRLKLAGGEWTESFSEGASSHTFDSVSIQRQQGRLEAFVKTGEQIVGPTYVEVKFVI